MVILERDNVFYCDCGFTWQRGKSGKHECADGLRQQVRALAAENIALTECSTDIMKHVYRSKTYLEHSRVVDAIQGLQCAIERKSGKTPATDAFLAEVRAQGVEMLADFCGTANNGYEIHLDIEEMRMFAAQLRQEAK